MPRVEFATKTIGTFYANVSVVPRVGEVVVVRIGREPARHAVVEAVIHELELPVDEDGRLPEEVDALHHETTVWLGKGS